MVSETSIYLRGEMYSLFRKSVYGKLFLSIVILSLFFAGCERTISGDDWNDNLPPAIPIDLFLFKASDGEIVIEWRKNSERDFSHYNIYRALNDTSSFSFLKKTNQNYFFDDSLFYDTTYFYNITAVDRYNMESSRSQIISALPINRYKPNAPRFVEINGRNWLGEESVYLSWEPNYETDVKNYYIYRSDAAAFNIDSSLLIGISHTIHYNDTSSLQIGKKYFYKITAVDNGGFESVPSGEVSDLVLPLADGIFPRGEVTVEGLLEFVVAPFPYACTIKIIVQENEFFGETWSKEISHTGGVDTIRLEANDFYMQRNKNYYWRIVTSSSEYFTPNSISSAIQFRVKQ